MFTLTKIEGGRINVFEPLVLKVGTTAVTSGQGLVLSGGLLISAGAGKPAFIALADGAANSEISVGRVEPNQVYEVASPGSVTVGVKYTLADGAKGITTTTASGVAEVVYADSKVAHIRFS